MSLCCARALLAQDVVLSSPGTADTRFTADRWLSTDEGDRQTYCVLYPDGSKEAASASGPKKYRVLVYTSDIR